MNKPDTVGRIRATNIKEKGYRPRLLESAISIYTALAVLIHSPIGIPSVDF